MDRPSLIFCALSLIVTIGISWAFYPLAAMAPEKLANWKVAADPASLPEINLGDFGIVSVDELIGYYIENPPAPPEAGAQPAREVRFSGC